MYKRQVWIAYNGNSSSLGTPQTIYHKVTSNGRWIASSSTTRPPADGCNIITPGNIALFAWLDSSGGFRSTSNFLTFSTGTSPGTGYTRLEYNGGRWYAMQPTSSATSGFIRQSNNTTSNPSSWTSSNVVAFDGGNITSGRTYVGFNSVGSNLWASYFTASGAIGTTRLFGTAWSDNQIFQNINLVNPSIVDVHGHGTTWLSTSGTLEMYYTFSGATPFRYTFLSSFTVTSQTNARAYIRRSGSSLSSVVFDWPANTTARWYSSSGGTINQNPTAFSGDVPSDSSPATRGDVSSSAQSIELVSSSISYSATGGVFSPRQRVTMPPTIVFGLPQESGGSVNTAAIELVTDLANSASSDPVVLHLSLIHI